MSTKESSQQDKMPALLAQTKFEKPMMEALRVLILREREKKRVEEEEADKAIEAKKQEQERLRKKREAETLNLEQTKEQIKALEEKRKSLQNEKHELFLQLKIVLNEDENRRKQQQKEKKAAAAYNHNQYHPAMPLPGPHLIVPAPAGSLHARPSLLGDRSQTFKTQTPPVQTIKRSRSPSPPVVQLYPHSTPHYPQGAFGQVPAANSPFRQQQGRGHPPFTSAQASSSAFMNQPVSGTSAYPQQAALHGSYSTGATSQPAKYQAREAHFPQGLPLRYASVHKGQGDSFPQGFQGFTPGSQHVQAATMDQAKQVYNEEKSRYQLQEQMRQLTAQAAQAAQAAHVQAAVHAQQQASILSQQQQQQAHLQQAQNKALSSTYPPRRKPDSPVYASKKSVPQRPGYQGAQGQPRSSAYPSQGHGQQGGRYF